MIPTLDFFSLFPMILGVLLLFFGRKLFWLFIGAAIFIAVMTLVPRYFPHHDSLIFYIAVGVGLVAAVVGVFLQKIALRVAGFLAGGFLFFSLWEDFAALNSLPWWLPFVVGGLLGALLLSVLFEWALIVLSSLTGAYLITEGLSLSASTHLAALVVLALIGIVVQGRMKKGKNRQPKE